MSLIFALILILKMLSTGCINGAISINFSHIISLFTTILPLSVDAKSANAKVCFYLYWYFVKCFHLCFLSLIYRVQLKMTKGYRQLILRQYCLKLKYYFIFIFCLRYLYCVKAFFLIFSLAFYSWPYDSYSKDSEWKFTEDELIYL